MPTETGYKAIIFDLDGVLVDACECHYLAFNRAILEVYKDTRFQISRQDHEALYNGLPTSKKYRMLLHNGRGFKPGLEKRVAYLKQIYTLEYANSLLPDENKIHLLQQLKYRGFKLGCCTNSIRKSAEQMLKNTGQLIYMDALTTNEDVSEPKPSPEGYLKTMNLLGVFPKESILVEDSPKGLLAAHATGATVLQVRNPDEVILEIFPI